MDLLRHASLLAADVTGKTDEVRRSNEEMKGAARCIFEERG
jgi:hypothetical protein